MSVDGLVVKVMFSFHVHDDDGWCRTSFTRWSHEMSSPNGDDLKFQAIQAAERLNGTVVGPLSYTSGRCDNPPVHPEVEERIVPRAKATAAPAAIQAYHLHTDEEPFCRSFHASEQPEENRKRAANAQKRYNGEVVGPLGYKADECAFKADMEALEEEILEDDDEEEIEEVEDSDESEESDDEPEEEEVDLDDEEPVGEEEDSEDISELDEEPVGDDDDLEIEDEDEEIEDEDEEIEEVEEEEPEPVPPARTRGKAAKAAASAPVAATKTPSKARPKAAAASAPAKTPGKVATAVKPEPEPIHVKAHSGIRKDAEVDLTQLECSGCGGSLDGHKCPSQAKRTGIKRKAAEEHPSCPHCGGRVHWNNGGALVNFECLYRQFLMESGEIADPSSRLPIFTAEHLKSMGKWADGKKKSGVELTYGKMEAAGGGGATYSGIKAATTKAAKAAAPGTRIEDVAEEVLPEPPKKLSKKELAAQKKAEAEAEAARAEEERKAKRKALLNSGKKGAASRRKAS